MEFVKFWGELAAQTVIQILFALIIFWVIKVYFPSLQKGLIEQRKEFLDNLEASRKEFTQIIQSQKTEFLEKLYEQRCQYLEADTRKTTIQNEMLARLSRDMGRLTMEIESLNDVLKRFVILWIGSTTNDPKAIQNFWNEVYKGKEEKK